MNVTRFQDIIGHADVIAHMQRAIAGEHISHAYILSGPEGIGKRSIARLFASTLLCLTPVTDEHGHIEPCGTCISCQKMESASHPDCREVIHEKPSTISVAEIREQVVADADIRPYESLWKVYIIPDADLMNPQAQNALLKTIEEPPSYAVILLLSENTDMLLPTIRSRCVELPLRAVPDEEVEQYLTTQLLIPQHKAAVIAAFAQGSIGKAIAFSKDDAFSNRVTGIVSLMTRIQELSLQQCVEAMEGLAADKKELLRTLDIIRTWYRDVLYFKATKEVDGLVFRERTKEITKQASDRSYEGLQSILDALYRAGMRIRANVDRTVTLELLFLTMMEN